MSVEMVIWFLFIHWVADFLFQDDKTAVNKSHNWYLLLWHSWVYFFILVFVGCGIYNHFVPSWSPSLLLLVNLPAHFITDAVTSRVNAKLYLNHRHWFFTMIGFDQVLHYTVLFGTLGG